MINFDVSKESIRANSRRIVSSYIVSTRSNIAIENQDGTSTYIYCHSDGYPHHNGRILFEHYQDPNKIREMLSHGDMSSLDTEIGEKHDFDLARYALPKDDPRRHWCRFYGRDRGETDIEARTIPTEELGCFEEYLYHYRLDGHWHVTCHDAEPFMLAELIPFGWDEYKYFEENGIEH